MFSAGSMAVAGGFMAGLGLLLAWLLALANRRLYVAEDGRVAAVEALLPMSNCGACGSAGCHNFAENLVAGQTQPAQCAANTPWAIQAIADLLGVAAGRADKRVARLACAGGDHVAAQRAHYAGLRSCRAAQTVSGGGKACAWGCLGLGDCVAVCTFGALSLDEHGLPQVDAQRCTGCGDCADVCPKQLFSIQSAERRLWLACANRADGDTAQAACEVACTACGKCVPAAPGVIWLDGHLAVIDPAREADFRSTPGASAAIDRCPTGAIVWFATMNQPVKGVAAKKILRQTALPGSTAAFGN